MVVLNIAYKLNVIIGGLTIDNSENMPRKEFFSHKAKMTYLRQILPVSPHSRTAWAATYLFLVVLVLACTRRNPNESQRTSPPKGYVALFSGQNLSGWGSPRGPLEGSWYVQDGEIRVRGKGPGIGALYTEKTYENFILELDYKIAPKGNSGIQIHAPWDGRQSRVGFELQILDDYGKEPTEKRTGSVYDVVAPRLNASKPAGEWNHYKVEMNWPYLRVWLNNEQIHDLDFAAHSLLRFRFRDGYFLLTRHGSDAAFRNIWIKVLPGLVTWDSLATDESLVRWRKDGAAQWDVHDGTIKASGGEGYLVSAEDFDAYELQAYVHKTQKHVGKVLYRWLNRNDPGYSAELYSFERAQSYQERFGGDSPWWIVPAFESHTWLPLQIISYEQFSEVRLNGIIVSRVLNHQKVRPGKVVWHYLGGDEPLEIRGMRIRRLEPQR